MGGKGALNYLPIVPKASIYVPNVMHMPVMGGSNTSYDTFMHMFLFRSAQSFEKLTKKSIWSVMAEYGTSASKYIPIVPKAFVYVPKVMHKPVMGSNTMSKTWYYCP